MRYWFVLLFMGPVCWANTSPAKPSVRGTLQFIYYVDRFAGKADDERTRQETEWARMRNFGALREWLNDPAHLPDCHERELRRDLNGDGRPEVFLVIGMGYHVD